MFAILLPEIKEQVYKNNRSMNFVDWIGLLGYELNSQQIARGETLLVTFYWEFFSHMPPDARIHINLKEKNGQGQQHFDMLPLNGYLPKTEVTSSTHLRDVHSLPLKTELSPGIYELELGWQSYPPAAATKMVEADAPPKIVWHTIGEIEVR